MATWATPATHTALGTTEILEMILLVVDMQTLLLAQRTCRMWREIIQGSPSLQKALFMMPHARSASDAPDRQRVKNPLLAKRFPMFFWAPGDPPWTDKDIKVMGLLDGADMCDERHPQKLEAYIRPEASWRQMHVQQPPVRELGIFEARYTEFEGESYHVYEISAYENGLTMGEYFEFLLFHNVMKGAARIVSWGKSTWPPWSRMMWMMGRTHDSDIMLRISAAVSRDEAGSSEYVPTETDLRRERICAEYERLGVEVHPLPDIPRWNEWEE